MRGSSILITSAEKSCIFHQFCCWSLVSGDLERLTFICYMDGKPWPALAAPHHATILITHQQAVPQPNCPVLTTPLPPCPILNNPKTPAPDPNLTLIALSSPFFPSDAGKTAWQIYSQIHERLGPLFILSLKRSKHNLCLITGEVFCWIVLIPVHQRATSLGRTSLNPCMNINVADQYRYATLSILQQFLLVLHQSVKWCLLKLVCMCEATLLGICDTWYNTCY